MKQSKALPKASQWILPLLILVYGGYRFAHYQQDKSLLRLDDNAITLPACPAEPPDDSAILVAALQKAETARHSATANPNNPAGWRNFAETAYANQDYLSTISALQAFQRLQPRLDPRQKLMLGNSMKECGLAQYALPILREALAGTPRKASAYVAVSQCLSRLGKNDDAIETLNQGGRNLEMTELKGRAELAAEFEMHSEWQSGLEQLQEAFAHSGDDPDIGIAVAREMQNSLKVSESQQFLEDLARRHPNHAGVQREIGFVLNSYQRKDRNARMAEHYYLKALSLDPKDIKAWTFLGDMYTETNRFRAAAYAYTKILEIDRYNYVRSLLARCYGAMGLDTRKVTTHGDDAGIRDQAEYFMRSMRYTDPNSAKSLLELPRHYARYAQYVKEFRSLQELYLLHLNMPEIKAEILNFYQSLQLPAPLLPAPVDRRTSAP